MQSLRVDGRSQSDAFPYTPTKNPGKKAFSDDEIREWFANTNISMAERKRIYSIVENFTDVDTENISSVALSRSSSAVGVGYAKKDDKENVHIEFQMQNFVQECVRESGRSGSHVTTRISREYATKEAFHVMMAHPDNEEGKLDAKWDLFPLGSILVYACVRWLEDVGGYKTPAAIQKIHRPNIVRKIIQCFTGHGDGGVQMTSLDDVADIEPSDVMHAIREYLMFVREDSVIPQSLVKHFIDKKRNMDSLKKLMTTGYLTFETRATLHLCIRHACNYYNLSKWPAELNISTLEYFAQSMAWITPDNTETPKDYRNFIRGFAVLLRTLVLSSIETY